jgi:hypothetical protein
MKTQLTARATFSFFVAKKAWRSWPEVVDQLRWVFADPDHNNRQVDVRGQMKLSAAIKTGSCPVALFISLPVIYYKFIRVITLFL